MVPMLDISLYSTDTFVKISRRRSCDHGISALASLFVIITNKRVRNCLIWRVNTISMCLKTVYNVTAKMLWPRSLGRTGSQLFITIDLICWAIRSCIMEISILFLAICHVQHFENGLVGVKYGQIVMLNYFSQRTSQDLQDVGSFMFMTVLIVLKIYTAISSHDWLSFRIVIFLWKVFAGSLSILITFETHN